jgi:hypothetical protein
MASAEQVAPTEEQLASRLFQGQQQQDLKIARKSKKVYDTFRKSFGLHLRGLTE